LRGGGGHLEDAFGYFDLDGCGQLNSNGGGRGGNGGGGGGLGVLECNGGLDGLGECGGFGGGSSGRNLGLDENIFEEEVDWR